MHDLLKRQLTHALGDEAPLPGELELLLDEVNQTYIEHDINRMELERALDIAAFELNEQGKILASELHERHDVESKLHYLANYDSVTGLVNRNLLQDRVQLAISTAFRYKQQVAIFVVGLDHFKLINESYGLRFGDELLKNVASLLTTCVRECDTVARLSGDEFVLLLSPSGLNVVSDNDNAAEDFNRSQLNQILQRILDAIARPLIIDGQELQVTCSIGACVYPGGGDTMDELLAHAGIALARAKQSGHNNYQFYTAHFDNRHTDKLSLQSKLSHAVERNELVLHYQPQVDLSTGDISGLEALIRWNHPELGLLSPLHFIPLAEETGLIISIGEWVLRTACRQIQVWQQAGFGELRIAVNLSARQFTQANLVDVVASVLAETGVHPHCLDIELTESYLMRDIEHAIDILHGIKALGIQVSIDDFGTGYSSLSYLKRLPINVLKIDQSFVRDITIDNDGAAISKAIISLAHSLGLRVIAEGVETESQCDFLRQHLCDEIQGFFYSKGLSAMDMENLLRTRKRLPEHLLHLAVKPRTLLLVDDEEKNIIAIKRLFRRDNLRILSAGNGIDALAILAQHNIDVIITDHHMPGMNGVDFLRIVKEKYPSTVRIMLSGNANMQAVIGAVNDGAVFQFLTKPYDDNQLRWHVGEAFKRKQLEDDNQRLTMEMQVANRDLARLNRNLKELIEIKEASNIEKTMNT